MTRIFSPFTTKEIKPTGWLKDQLIIQAKGLSGNLDKIWNDVKNSKWIGGSCEGWERVPYWLDGFIPLAYLLNDEDMIARAKRFVDAIIAGQKEDGWICPCEDNERNGYDTWALYLILKVLIVYYDCSGDERIEEVVYKALKQYYDFNRHNTVFNWAASRWYECVISIAWLYERRPEKWLLDLASFLETQGFDYQKCLSYLKKKTEMGCWSYYNHVVNLAMSLKSDAVMSVLDGRNPEKNTEKFLGFLTHHHGNINGYFNGDETLAGTSPSQGTELCGVAEAMYSYEIISTCTKNTKWMDRCERLAFNAFPATVSEDMWTHQYDQMTNQPYCAKLKNPHFTSNNGEAHLFGLEPNFGCCTANHNQAFPKFTLSCFMREKDGIAVTSLAPCSVSTTAHGVPVTVTTETLYPFRDSVKIKVDAQSPVEFTLFVRIPGFYDYAVVDGERVESGRYYEIKRKWDSDEIDLQLFATPHFVKRGTLFAVQRGALTYAVPVKERWEKIEYIKNGVERVFPYCDYEIFPESEWQYGFASDELTYEEKDEYKSAFATSAPLCTVKAKVARIDWGLMKKNGLVAKHKPTSTAPLSEPIEIELVPYGCAKLRMTELPFVK